MKSQKTAYFILKGKKIFCEIISQNENLIIVKSIHPINKELGLAKNQNPLQGSFIINELTDLVEEAVLTEFDRITERGGVLGAMETMYQRSKIQEKDDKPCIIFCFAQNTIMYSQVI